METREEATWLGLVFKDMALEGCRHELRACRATEVQQQMLRRDGAYIVNKPVLPRRPLAPVMVLYSSGLVPQPMAASSA